MTQRQRLTGRSGFDVPSVCTFTRIVFQVFVGVMLIDAPSLQAQTPQELQAELQEMKQLYEQRIAILEGRIATLEQQNAAIAAATKQNTVSVSDLFKRLKLQRQNRRRLPRAS